MVIRAASHFYEVVLPEENGNVVDILGQNAHLVELFLAEIPNNELSPLFSSVFKFVHKNYNCDVAFCASIHSEMKAKLLEKKKALNFKDYYFRMNWSSSSKIASKYREEISPLLILSKNNHTICFKNKERHFFRIFLGEKEGQEYYFLFSNKLSETVSVPFVSQVKKFLQTRFKLCCDLEVLEKFKALVYLDDVTGLYNQRKLTMDLEQLSAIYQETGAPFAVLFIDIDYFKRVNDGHGHLVGTQLLDDLAKLLKKILRESDLIYRYGGDEFVMILPNFTPENARSIAERILRAVKKEEFLKDSPHPFKLSVSIGVAGVPAHAKAPHELLAMADQMMYTAKSSGRGKVCMAGELFE